MKKSEENAVERLSKRLKKESLDCLSIDTGGRNNRFVRLSGDLPVNESRLKAASAAVEAAVKKGPFRAVVTDITIGGMEEPPMRMPSVTDRTLDGRRFDAVVIGGGVIGCAIARELTRYDITVALLEKEADVAMQASGRNDGMVHPGFAASIGSLKAAYNTRGNRMYTKAAEELGFELKRPGSILLFNNPMLRLILPYMKYRASKNGVDGNFGSLTASEVMKMEPLCCRGHYGGFYMPSAGIVSPFQVTAAYADNAAENGASIFFNTAVTGLDTVNSRITAVRTNRGTFSAGVVINAAGVWADRISEMAGDRFFSIHGRKGVDAILDKKCGPLQNHIMGMPDLLATKQSHSKGGGIVPCVEGNILLGPTAIEVFDREDYSTTAAEIEELKKHLHLNTKLGVRDIITYYGGVRAATWEEDFIIETSADVPNLVLAAGIQSPGLASAPAIAADTAANAIKVLTEACPAAGERPALRKDFNPVRKAKPEPARMSAEEKQTLIAGDPSYGKIVCRCEQISEGEIRAVLKGPVPVTTVDGIKHRTRAGAGRCHGGFCLPRILSIISEETGKDITGITKKGGDSGILVGKTKDEI